jgi:hypothetical protein
MIAFSVVVIVAIHISLFFAMQRYQARKPDFASLYQAGRALIHERFPAIVNRFPALNGEEFIVQTPSGPFPADTMHPPYELAIYASLALMKFRMAYPFWWGCNLVLLLLATFLLWRNVPCLQSRYPYLLILAATFFPVLVALVQGQNSVLLLFLLTLTFHLLGRNRHFWAGFALSMGMFKFVLVIPILLWLVLEKRWKSIAGFLSGYASLLLAAAWLVGFRGLEAYVRLVAGYAKTAPEKAGTESIMPNLRGMVHAIGAGVAPETLLVVITLLLSLTLLFWVDLRRTKQTSLSMRFSMQVLLAALISYHLYPHDAAVLVLPWLLFLDYSLEQGSRRGFATTATVASLVLYLVPFVAPLQIGMPIIGLAAVILLAFLQRPLVARPMQMASS